jgi:minor extracellular protease Epr
MKKKVTASLLASVLLFGFTSVAFAGPLVPVGTEQSGWGFEKMAFQLAWDKGFTGKGVKIAILDSGVAPHSDLNVAGGVSTVNYTNSYADDNGHGTLVAGIIAGKRDGVGFVGIAPDAQIYAVKVLDSAKNGNTLDLVEGINWAIDNGMDIINISIGNPSSNPVVEKAINRAIEAGIIVVASAGNNGNAEGTGSNVSFPGQMDAVITVAAVDESMNRGYFPPSNYSSTGDAVDFAAPGVDIVSTSKDGGYELANGTSMAAPFITGMIAILKQAFPTATPADINAMLVQASQDLGQPGKDTWYGYGFPSFERIPGIGYDEPVIDPIQLQKATAAVELSEKYKAKVYMDRAHAIVNTLPDSPEKTALLNRLYAISSPTSDNQEMLKRATSAVELAERYKASIYVNKAFELVNKLPDSSEKTNLEARLVAVQAAIDAENALQQQIADATAKVQAAEASKLQYDVDVARAAVYALPEGQAKASLMSRLDAVQAAINSEMMLQQQIADATAKVQAAEISKSQADVDIARAAVNLLPDGQAKTDLTIRLNAIVVTPSSPAPTQEELQRATAAVELAERYKAKVFMDRAYAIVNTLPDSSEKTELINRLIAINQNPTDSTPVNEQDLKKATQAVELAEKYRASIYVNRAKELVDALPDCPEKEVLAQRVNAVVVK